MTMYLDFIFIIFLKRASKVRKTKKKQKKGEHKKMKKPSGNSDSKYMVELKWNKKYKEP